MFRVGRSALIPTMYFMLAAIPTGQSPPIIFIGIWTVLILIGNVCVGGVLFGHYFLPSYGCQFSRTPPPEIAIVFCFRAILIICDVLVKDGWIVSSSSATTSTLAVYLSLVIIHNLFLFFKNLFIVVSFIHFPIFHLLSHHQSITAFHNQEICIH